MEFWRWQATWRGQRPSTRERSLHATRLSSGTGAISKWRMTKMSRTWTWTWPGGCSDWPSEERPRIPLRGETSVLRRYRCIVALHWERPRVGSRPCSGWQTRSSASM